MRDPRTRAHSYVLVPWCASWSPILFSSGSKTRSDGCVFVRIAQESEDALTELDDKTNPMVYGLVLRILGESSSTEDVIVKVYLQVWHTANSFSLPLGAR